MNPVKDKRLNKKIKNDLLQVLEKYKSEIGSEAEKIFTNKINALNQITNEARLKAPFESLQLPLLADDLKIIRTRNDFLHGRVPDIMGLGTARDLKRVNGDLYYAAMRLYTLLNMIILKSIGFDNYVLNFAKIQEQACQVPIKEKHYRKLT